MISLQSCLQNPRKQILLQDSSVDTLQFVGSGFPIYPVARDPGQSHLKEVHFPSVSHVFSQSRPSHWYPWIFHRVSLGLMSMLIRGFSRVIYLDLSLSSTQSTIGKRTNNMNKRDMPPVKYSLNPLLQSSAIDTIQKAGKSDTTSENTASNASSTWWGLITR